MGITLIASWWFMFPCSVKTLFLIDLPSFVNIFLHSIQTSLLHFIVFCRLCDLCLVREQNKKDGLMFAFLFVIVGMITPSFSLVVFFFSASYL